MRITVLPALGDNYIYVASDVEGNAAVVDPAEGEMVLDFLSKMNLRLIGILVTHSHADHIGGLRTLKQKTGCRVIGPPSVCISNLDIAATEGHLFNLPATSVRGLSTPGHTNDSVCYYIPPSASKPGILFTGDTLFVNGCGRLFSDDAQIMWQSLCKLAALPDDTLIYCGHNYTEENYRFALTIEPNHPAILKRLDEVREDLRQSRPTVPSTIGREKQLNPFLRADTAPIRQALSMPDAPAWQVFGQLRKRKDQF